MVTPRDLGFCALGTAVGAGVMYVVLDKIHAKELDEVYAIMEEGTEAMRETSKILDKMFEDDVDDDASTDDKLTMAPFSDEEVSRITGDDGGAGEEGDPDLEEGEPMVVDVFDEIHVINPDQVGERIIVGKYNHLDGSYEIDENMSVKNDFDEVVENDALYSLLNEEAYDILMSSSPIEDANAKRRVLAVRNGVINLDFLIVY